jgi:polyisoprenoid-binding protein YceI
MRDTDKITRVPVEPPEQDRPGGIPRWVKFTVLGLIGLVVLFFGAIFLYAKVLNDSPDEFTEADLDAALSAEAGQDPDTAAPEATVATAEPPVAATTPAAEAPPTEVPVTEIGQPAPAATTLPPAGATVTSTWEATDQSQVGYRVEEVLFGVNTTAVGRTNEVDGSLTIGGTAVTGVDFSVEVASITSDESRRDSAFQGRVMSADEFPNATFVLTQPIELGVEPADGVEVTSPVTGELTLRGVTNPVTFDVTAKQENGLIGVQGSIPVLFSDYGIANPSSGGITTEDNGLVEFVLVFEPA